MQKWKVIYIKQLVGWLGSLPPNPSAIKIEEEPTYESMIVEDFAALTRDQIIQKVREKVDETTPSEVNKVLSWKTWVKDIKEV